MKRIVAGLLVLLLAASLIVMSGCSSNKKIDAWVCAQNVVEGRLKSPSTAKFCSYDSSRVTELGNNKYRIVGYVDAQNSFGATVRSNFTVTLTLTEHGYKDASCSLN